ncbi:TIGR02444 family protein [Vibrio sp. SM6]|uniref:TIGR02444 family protein n=1 Tax=Vibrio agarilyticus TaxID=2726741 RepID=A0A7X8YII7_9VIBR|nr:TIGR02444 family protein [Vibrio agarilyticus]NLS14665.1 TIGR02444 family protein [Vibrio agarilyticus]
MNDARTQLTFEHLWQFSLRYYAMPDVKQACLSLQNRHQGNVNFLLLIKWLDEQHFGVDEEGYQALQQALSRCEPLLEPYRDLRRQLKRHLPETLYRQTLEFELQLEKMQQTDLIIALQQQALTMAQDVPLTTRYCIELGAPHLAVIFAASMGHASPSC